MKAIGGYFELADYEEGKGFPHKDGILLNTGRNALEYILRSIDEIKGIYLPYYTCEVVFEPLKKLHIPWFFYHINASFEMVEDIQPKEGEYIIANNYFGIKDAYIKSLAQKYGSLLIVDCAQALFAKPIEGIKCFYSTRKYVGVADGGVAYLGDLEDGKVGVDGVECTVDHDKHLFTRKQFGAETGFADFRDDESKLDNQPIRWMSDTTNRILGHVNFEKVLAIRRTNFAYLHKALNESNPLQLPELSSIACPMAYPFLAPNKGLREKLIDNKVFVARYWPNVLDWTSEKDIEYLLSYQLQPLPIDQRYSEEDMRRIVEIVNQ